MLTTPDLKSKTCRFLLLVAFAPAAFGDVLYDHDNGPLTGLFGIPDSTEGSHLPGSGQFAWNVSLTGASHSIDDTRPTETFFLDGETTRLAFRYRYGVNDKLELGFEIPYLQHHAGQLDSLIDAWHRLFGLPEGNRPDRAHDILDFKYVDASDVMVDVTRESRGIGDIRLFGGWQLIASDRYKTALRFGAKIPTGDSDKLNGSGGMDLSVGLAGDVNRLFGFRRLNGFYRLHAIHLGKPDLLVDRAKNRASYVSTGLGLIANRWLELRLQVASRSALYQSSIRNLGHSATTVTVGGNIRIGEHYDLSLAVTEDADAGTAPDVAFQIAIRYRSKRRKHLRQTAAKNIPGSQAFH